MSEIGEFDSIASDKPTVSVQALELGKQLVEILEGTKQGLEEQGAMARKMGTRIFKKSAKMPVEDWIEYAKELLPEFEKLKGAVEKGDKEVITQAMAPITEAQAKLVDLKDNYIKTANLVGKVLKGEELEDALEGLEFSEKKIDLLVQAIEFLKNN